MIIQIKSETSPLKHYNGCCVHLPVSMANCKLWLFVLSRVNAILHLSNLNDI